MNSNSKDELKFLLVALGVIGLVCLIAFIFIEPDEITVCIELDSLFLDDPSFVNFKTTYPYLTEYLSDYRDDCRGT